MGVKTPQLHYCEEVRSTVNETKIDGRWVAARPIAPSIGIIRRFKLAFKVFIGEYDALKWYKQ